MYGNICLNHLKSVYLQENSSYSVEVKLKTNVWVSKLNSAKVKQVTGSCFTLFF